MFRFKHRTSNKTANEWTTPSYFVMALICWSFGIINTWKFPELLYKYGNISVIIPHTIVLILLVVPIVFLELIVGQYTNRGSFAMWMMGPIWRGAGWASTFILLVSTTYNHYLTTQALFYVFKSVNANLPWAYCTEATNCYNLTSIEKLKEKCLDTTKVNCTIDYWPNSVEYYYNLIIMQKASSNFTSGINWLMVAASFISLLFTYICTYDSITSIERIIHLLILVPFLQLVVLMLTSLLYRGSFLGLSKFLRPNLNLLLDMQLWLDVFNFNSSTMGLGLGGLIAIASHSNFRTNVYSIATFIPVLGLFTNLLFSIFVYSSFAGFTRNGGISIDEFFKYNQSMNYVKIPMLLLKWPYIPHIWSLFYFCYLYIIGFRATLFMIFTLTKIMNDGWSKTNAYKKSTVFSVCIIVFLLGLVYYTNIGYSIYLSIDKLCTGSLLSLIIVLELFGVLYLYGVNNIVDDVNFMLNIKLISLKYYWKALPMLIFAVLIYNIYVWMHGVNLNWLIIMEAAIFATPILLWLIHFFGHWIYNRKRSWKIIFGPHLGWGNVNLEIRKARDIFKNEAIGEEFTYIKELYTKEIKEAKQ